MNFFGVYGYKIRDLGVDGFINSFKCKKVLKSNLFRTIEGLKNFINTNSDTLNKNIEFSEMSFDDLLYECFSTSDYVQDTFGYQESRLPRDGFMWFPEFCCLNNSLDRILREAAFE